MKYIIDIDTDKVFTDGQNNKLYKAKGFNSLVFDQNGLDKLQPLETFEHIEDTPAYKKGFDAGAKWAVDENVNNHEAKIKYGKEQYDEGLEKGYTSCLDSAEAAKEYLRRSMTSEERDEVFGWETPELVLLMCSIEAIIKKTGEHKKEEENAKTFQVGDEVVYNRDRRTSFIVTSIDYDGHLYGIAQGGDVYTDKLPECWIKTGRNIADKLDMLFEE